jgi:hypothetical protein
MKRRHFLKITLGVVGGAAALVATAQAAPLSPYALVEGRQLPATQNAHPAAPNGNEVDRVLPEKVRFTRHFHRRHWRHHK